MNALPLPSVIPSFNSESLYVGIDVAKSSHVAAFVSNPLLKQYKTFSACPTLSFENSRIGFECLVQTIKSYAESGCCTVVLERTGHYHLALLQYLQEQAITTYELHLQKRPSRNKSDKRDAQSLANIIYNQIALGVQASSSEQFAHRVTPLSQAAIVLRGLVRHRIELAQEATQRKNKLTSIADQIFPEAAHIIRDPNGAAMLRLWQQYDCARDLAAAPLDELMKARSTATRPGREAFVQLKEAATRSIGVSDPARVLVLSFERRQLIAELQLLQSHIEQIDVQIEEIISASREGQILASIPMISPVMAASIIASIGTIANFESAAKLRGYAGWAPNQRQTGTSFDSMTLTRGGNRTMKRNLYLIGWIAIRTDTEWRALYERLVPIVCRFDQRTQRYKGKNKVMGRIIGQIIGLIYHLLRTDYELLRSLEEGEVRPAPMLYNRTVHRAHMHR